MKPSIKSSADLPGVPSTASPELIPITIDAKSVARLTGLSVRTIRRLQSSGQMPPPKRIGSRVLWMFDEIRAWAAAGFPKSPENQIDS